MKGGTMYLMLAVSLCTHSLAVGLLNTGQTSGNDVIDVGSEVPAFTWERLLTGHLPFEEEQESSDESKSDILPIQEFLADFGRSLDHCNSKIEESAELSKHLIHRYMENVIHQHSPDSATEDDVIDEVIMKDIQFEDEVAVFSDELLLEPSNSVEQESIWQSLQTVLTTLNDACDNLPPMIAETDIQTHQQPGKKVETVLESIIRAMTKWTQKWTTKLRTVSSNFIDICVTTPGCEKNLKLIVDILSDSLEKSKTLRAENNQGINLHTLIGSSSFWDHVQSDNPALTEANDEAPDEPGDFTSSLRARLQKMAGIFSYFGGASDNEDLEYVRAAGVEGDPVARDSSVSVQLLEDSPAGVEDELPDDDQPADDIRMQRMVAAAVNVLRFPWTLQKQNKVLVSVSQDAPLHELPPTFLSLALESQLIHRVHGHQFDPTSEKLRALMTPLSPAVFRLGGSSANFLSFDPTLGAPVEDNEIHGWGEKTTPGGSPFASDYHNRVNRVGGRYGSLGPGAGRPRDGNHDKRRKVPESHPKFRQIQNELKQLGQEKEKVVNQADYQKKLKKHPKFLTKMEKRLEDNLSKSLSPRGNVMTQDLGSKKHNWIEVSPVLSPQDGAVPSGRQQLVKAPHSSAQHPKLAQRRSSRLDDAPPHKGRLCDRQPHFHNFTVTGSELSSLLDLCLALNWTVLFDLNQFTRLPTGGWDPSNARHIIRSVQQSGVSAVWQLGNEPNNYAHKFEFNISGSAMVDDVTTLRQEVVHGSSVWQRLKEELGYDNSISVVGPDVTRPHVQQHVLGEGHVQHHVMGEEMDLVGVPSTQFLEDFLRRAGPGLVDAVTWHQYYVCGRTSSLQQFTDPAVMELFTRQLAVIRSIRDQLAPRTPIWITETGSAYGGGAPGLSNRFAGSFLWLDKLGVAARDGVSVVARQSLFGGHYAMLDDSYDPNPDYWVSVLHKQLAGGRVLGVTLASNAPSTLRLYGHCIHPEHPRYSPGGLVLFGLNSGSEEVGLTVAVPPSTAPSTAPLLQYLLTPALGDLTAKTVLLNGVPLTVGQDGALPPLLPSLVPMEDLALPAHSLAFWLLPDAGLPACQ